MAAPLAQAGLFTGFSLMLQAAFRALTKTATAAEKLASAGDHLAGYLDDTAATFADQAKAERLEKMAIFEHNLKIRKEEIAKATSQLALPNNTPQPEAT